jgi:copper resistance protein C
MPGHRARAILAALLAVLAVAAPAMAHASLVSSDPADGASVPFPDAITLTFDDDLDAAKSEFLVVGSDGATAATGHVTANTKVMQATGLALAWGAYEVRWIAVASDGDLTRGIVSFAVIQPGAVSLGPGAPTAAASGAPSSDASAAPSVAVTSDPSSTAGPAASADPSPTTTGTGGADVILPIVGALALVGLVAILVLRRGRAA